MNLAGEVKIEFAELRCVIGRFFVSLFCLLLLYLRCWRLDRYNCMLTPIVVPGICVLFLDLEFLLQILLQLSGLMRDKRIDTFTRVYVFNLLRLEARIHHYLNL
jgi:hypothetical protein